MHGSAEAHAAEQAVVQHALARGWLTQEQLRETLLLQHRLSAEGQPTGLLPLLARVLPPAQLPALAQVWQQAGQRARTASARLVQSAGSAAPSQHPGPAPQPAPLHAAEVPERLLRQSSELLRRPPAEDPEPVRRFLEESRRGQPAAAIPTRLGGYRVVREIARGGMGIVYEAHALGLDRRVALKVLRDPPDEDDLLRFQREARAAARLRHPAIVGVHEVGEDRGTHFIAMDFVQGPSLKARILAEGPLPPRDAARIALRVAEALQHAHEHGVLHRDVKPHNVLLDEASGEAVLGDFGLAKELDKKDGLTHTGVAMGTPAYMSPEQVEGRPVDGRSDVWSLGATLYEALAARSPFQATTPVGMARAILHEDAAPPSRWRGGIPPDLETVCLKCLEKDPARRYASPGQLARDLGRFLADEPVSARRPGAGQRLRRWARRQRAALLSGALAALVAGAALLVREHLAQSGAAAAQRERHAELERLLARARELGLPGEEARTAAVFQLARLSDPQAVERLGRELQQVTTELRAAELAIYQDAAEPDAQERARDEPPLTGLEAALAARAPGEALPRDPAARELVSRAWRRLEERARRARTDRDLNGPAPPRALELVARAQTQRLGKRADVARLCCEGLARIEGGGGARAALVEYLAAECDPVRAAAAAMALAQLGGEEALRPVLASLDRFSEAGAFTGPVKRALASGAAHATGTGSLGDLRALLVRGELREVAHDWAGAREAYDAALALDPRCAEAWRRRGEARLHLHDDAGARADCDHALELAPADALAWMARSQVRLEQSDLDGALSDASRAVELAPSDARTWRMRALVRTKQKDATGALADANHALELDPRDALSWTIRGQTRHEAKDADALTDIDRALELEPRQPSAWRARGAIHFEQGDLAAALADYQRALELDETSIATWVNRGAVRIQLGDHVGAQADCTHALELDPQNPDAWDNRARSRLMQGDHAGAAADAARALELRPGLARPWVTRGVANLKQGRVREALIDLDRAVELSPQEADVWSNRAAARTVQGDLAAARADLDRAVALAPDEATFWINRGRVRRAQGDAQGALEDLSRAIGLAPKNPRTWQDRGNLRADHGDLQGGVDDLQRAVQLDQSDPHLHYDLAVRLIQGGAYEDARRALDEVLLRDKRMADAWGARGGVALLLGDEAAALSDYQRFLELAPDHPEAPAVRKLLAERAAPKPR